MHHKPSLHGRLHAVLAAFFLPIGIMFLVTGALYTLEIQGSYRSRVIEVSLSETLRADVEQLSGIARQTLAAQGIDLPTGKPKLKRAGDYFELEWTGANRDVVVQPGIDELSASVVVKDTTFYRRMVQLHKAKGSWAFKSFAVGWSVGLLMLFVSGLLLAWQSRQTRTLAMASSLAGIVVFLVLVILG